MRKIIVATAVAASLATTAVVYLTVRIAIGAGLDPAGVVAVAVLPLMLCGLGAAVAFMVMREARDRVAAIVAREVQRSTVDADVPALRAAAWPTAADVTERLHAAAEYTREASDHLGEVCDRMARPGRHRSDVLADTAEIDVAELLDDTMPKLYTHETLFRRGV